MVGGGGGNDLVDGGNGTDTLCGTPSDRLSDLKEINLAWGGVGDDAVHTGNGDYTISGGDGSDRLFSGSLHNAFTSGPGDDTGGTVTGMSHGG